MQKASILLWLGAPIFAIMGGLAFWRAATERDGAAFVGGVLMLVLTAIVCMAIRNPQRGDDTVRALGKLYFPVFLLAFTAYHGYQAIVEQSIWQAFGAIIFALCFFSSVRCLRRSCATRSPPLTNPQ